jgi:hypothetical protein
VFYVHTYICTYIDLGENCTENRSSRILDAKEINWASKFGSEFRKKLLIFFHLKRFLNLQLQRQRFVGYRVFEVGKIIFYSKN